MINHNPLVFAFRQVANPGKFEGSPIKFLEQSLTTLALIVVMVNERKKTMARQGKFRQGLQSCLVTLVSLTLTLVMLQGCAGLRPRNPLPETLESKVQVVGMPGVRAWGDEVSEVFTKFTVESVQQERAAYGQEILTKPVYFLALSGGGDDGAFGAGVLCGWTAHGDRPEFKLVTGISTGALIAPFAFLGSSYDDTLRYLYTGITGKDIFPMKSLLTVLWRESVADTQPLARMLDKYVDESMLAEIAAAHAKGRRLIIGTTQLDAQRLVLWDMGAIASSGSPDAVKLFRKIMLTSASIPGAFPPAIYQGGSGRQILRGDARGRRHHRRGHSL